MKKKLDGISKQYPATVGLGESFNSVLISEMKEKGFLLGAAPQDDFLYFMKVWSGAFGIGMMLSVFLTEENDMVTVTVRVACGYAINNFIRKDIDTSIETAGADGEVQRMNVIDFIFSITDRVYNERR